MLCLHSRADVSPFLFEPNVLGAPRESGPPDLCMGVHKKVRVPAFAGKAV